MSNYLDIINQTYTTLISANHDYSPCFSVCPVDISINNIELAYCICHPILGNLLEFGWTQGAETDQPAIKVALCYCAYAGLVANYLECRGIISTAEELFFKISHPNGLLDWCENAINLVGIDKNGEAAKQLSFYFEQCSKQTSKNLPIMVADQLSEVQCVDACVAMFYLGKSIRFT